MNKDGLDLLKKIGEMTYKEVQVDVMKDFKVTLKTLTSKEETGVYEACAGLANTLFINRFKIEVLARSIIKINDIHFDSALSDDADDKTKEKFQEAIKQKVDIITNSWSATIVDDLYTHYNKLMGEVESKLKPKRKSKK